MVQLCFATIFTLALRGLGRHTKRGGSFLVAAISGGAVFPPMTGAVATHTGNFHTAMAIPVAGYVMAWVFPIYVNLYKKDSMDKHRETDLNIDHAHQVQPKEYAEQQLDPVNADGKYAVQHIESA